MIGRCRTLSCLLFSLCLAFGPSCLAGEAAEPSHILWAGSSSMYFHDAPKVLAEWLTARANIPAKAEIVGRSGTGVHVYLWPGFKAEYGLAPGESILDKIAREKFDYVVLQVPAEFINGPEGEEHDRSLDLYCQAIRDAGGSPVFYEMGWGTGEPAAVGRAKIFAAAVRCGVTHFAPCSTAWQRVRRERPGLALQDPPDLTHPGTLGCYLNLCCFYAAIAGKEPRDMTRRLPIWRHLSDEEKEALKPKVDSFQFDEYDQKLAGWMKRRVVGAEEVEVPRDTAEYLQHVAWEEYRDAQRRLQAAIDAKEKP